MSNVTNRQLNIFIESGEAQRNLDLLTAKQKKFTDELANATNPKRIRVLNDELAKLAEPIDRATKKLNGQLNPSFRDLEKSTKRWLDEFKKTGDPATLNGFAKLNAELQKSKDQINSLTDGQKGLTNKGIFSGAFWGNLAANGISLAISKIKEFFSSAIDEAEQSEKIRSIFKNTLQNLGAPEAFDRLSEKAKQLRQSFTFLTETDILNVFKKLVDFGKLTEVQMNKLLPVIINFSAKSGQSLGESADTIIKALEGSKAASGVLRTFGIDMRAGRTEAERYNIVMTLLKDKVEGAGDAFAKTAAGGMAAARAEMEQSKEEIGTSFLPILAKLYEALAGLIKGFVTLGRAIRDAFSGKASFSSSLVEAASTNPENVKAQQKNSADELKLLDSKIKSLHELQAKGQQLDKTDADVRAAFVISATKREADLTAKIEILKKRSANTDAQKDELLGLINAQKGIGLAVASLAVGSNKPLGLPGTPDAGELAAAEAARKRAEELRKQLLADIDKFKLEAKKKDKDAFTQEVVELDDQYNKLRERAKGNKDLLLEIETAYHLSLQNIADKYNKLDSEAQKKKDEEKKKQQEETEKKLTDIAIAGMNERLHQLQRTFELVNRDRLAADELKVLQTQGRKKLKAELELLKEEEKQELNAKELTENEKLLIEKKYQDKRRDAEVNHITDVITKTTFFLQAAATIDKIFSDAKTQRENQELEGDRLRNEKKKTNLERRLKSGLITQLQYDREVQKMERDQERREKEARRKQFERDKRAQILAAVINLGGAVTTTLREFGPPIPPNFLGIAAMATTLLVGGLQIAAIAKQKAPEFARGGRLDGRSHAEGGNPILDGHGRKIGEIERGEGILNKHTMGDKGNYTVTGTPSQIASKLNSIRGGVNWESGAKLEPGWASRKPVPFNFPNINRYYAAGGTFDKPISTAATQNSDELKGLLIANMATLDKLHNKLDEPIKAFMLLSDAEQAQLRKQRIVDDATLK